MKTQRTAFAASALLALTLAACSGGGNDGSSASGAGAGQATTTTPAAAAVTTTTPATTPTTVAAAPTTTAAAATQKANANTASQSEIQAALTAAGVSNAARWAVEVVEYRPYPTNDPNMAKLRQNLAKYNPGPGVVDQIISALSL